ncbi:MAG TPA: HD domain-containing protein, partial [Pyrinomonadaceae bacterium]|nr:HD domain-containing protein [Pyrinomonadaceae bacterium]
MQERNYRDAVHNLIRIPTDNEAGKLLARLIDSPEVQRLRRIRQLGLAYFAYQSAEHSRFTHSLGAYHFATRIIERLSKRHQIDEEQALSVRVAALLHDVGHGPFSHVMESIIGFHHEDYTVSAILDNQTVIGRLLSGFSATLQSSAAEIIRGKWKPRALAQLVSSQLDVDRMDYLLRDSIMTGVKYGLYDVEWIIRSLEIDTENDFLFVQNRGLFAVEDYLQARYYMFRQVYFHRTLRAAECVLRSMIKRAVLLKNENRIETYSKAFSRLLDKKKLTLAEHFSLDDSDVFFHIKSWQSSEDRIISDLARRFLNRRLLKAIELDDDISRLEEKMQRAAEVLSRKGFDPDYYLVLDSAG